MLQARLTQRALGGRHLTLLGVVRTLSTLASTGMTIFPDRPLVLLPLLESEESRAGSAPLHRLSQQHGHDTSRIAFRIPSGISSRSNSVIDWVSSTHVFPSAYPRSHPASTSPPSDTMPTLDIRRAALDKTEERRAREDDFALWDQIARRHPMESFFPPRSEEEAKRQAEALSTGKHRQPQLWTAVQRLAPREPVKGGITLFLGHANGFHKELFEPTMESMLKAMAEQPEQSPPIAEIWSMDNVDSGESALLNEEKLGLAVSWFDQSRDMQQFLDYYMPAANHTSPNLLLPRNERGAARRSRKVVGVGHSFNGAGFLMLSSLSPHALDGVFLIDPVGVTLDDFPKLPIPADTPLSRGAIARKDVFTSRNAAREYMSSRPFFTAWDPRVLELHLRHGLRVFPGTSEQGGGDPPVTLSQSKWREALAYSSYFLGTFSYAQVERSRFQGWAHLICMSDSDNVFFGERGSGPLVERFPAFAKRASSEVMPGGHLVVLEQPDQLGVRLAQVLAQYEKPSHL